MKYVLVFPNGREIEFDDEEKAIRAGIWNAGLEGDTILKKDGVPIRKFSFTPAPKPSAD